MAVTAVTPAGVRDGDPDALAGLCDRRGPAVLAYCEIVAGRGQAAASAAADAFGSFRAGVAAAEDLADVNPEALLISATRHCAARYAAAGVPAPHSRVPALLAARADRSISLTDHDWLEEHLTGCWTCRAPFARFDSADRAYLDPPSTPLAPDVAAEILAAMIAAAPVRGSTAETPAIAMPNAIAAGTGYVSPDAGQAPPPDQATEYELQPLDGYGGSVDQPTSMYAAGDLDAPDPAAEAPAPARRRQSAKRPSLLGAIGLGSGSGRGAGRARASRASAAPPGEPRAAAGTNLPRPRRATSATSATGGRALLRPGVVLPVALVVLAIVIALLIAGVFRGGESEAKPQSFAPETSAPASTPEPPVVVVPGADSASAAAVEKAKARARSARRRAAQAAGGRSDPTTVTPPPAAAPAAPAAAPAAQTGDGDRESTPPANPDREQGGTSAGGEKPKIDAGNGATGAEQLPPAEDTSTVPELAPPAEPAAQPPG